MAFLDCKMHGLCIFTGRVFFSQLNQDKGQREMEPVWQHKLHTVHWFQHRPQHHPPAKVLQPIAQSQIIRCLKRSANLLLQLLHQRFSCNLSSHLRFNSAFIIFILCIFATNCKCVALLLHYISN